MKKTPWFPASVNPVRPGNYEVKYHLYKDKRDKKVTRLFWTGLTWRNLDSRNGHAMFQTMTMMDMYNDKWRGLME